MRPRTSLGRPVSRFIFPSINLRAYAIERDTGRLGVKYRQYASVAQMDRAPDSDSGGRGFKPRRAYHIIYF